MSQTGLPESPKVADVLDGVVVTLDRYFPRWRHLAMREVLDGLPRDDRIALAAVARGVFGGRAAPPEAFGLHPELLAAASDEEIAALVAEAGARDSNPVLGSELDLREGLLRLRDHARRMHAIARARDAPFATALRAAHEVGRAEELLNDLPAGAPPFRASAERDEFALALTPRRFAAVPEVARWLERLGVDLSGPLGPLAEMRASVAFFVRGEGAVCGALPRCDVCELAARALCPAIARANRGADVARRPRIRRAAVALERGAEFLRQAEVALDAVRRRPPPNGRLERLRWLTLEVEPTCSRLGAEVKRSVARLQRVLLCLENPAVARFAAENAWEECWALVSRLGALDEQRAEFQRRAAALARARRVLPEGGDSNSA